MKPDFGKLGVASKADKIQSNEGTESLPGKVDK
jgi:hypothetical protein